MNVGDLKEAIEDLDDDMLVAMDTEYGPTETTFADIVEVLMDKDGVIWRKEKHRMWQAKSLKVFLMGW